jgi:hypothetical protein
VFSLGSRRFDMTRHRLSPVPGQKLTQPLDCMIVDTRQHVGEPGLWIDIVELGGGDEGVDGGGTAAAIIGAGEGPVPWRGVRKLSTTILSFSSSDQRRRPPPRHERNSACGPLAPLRAGSMRRVQCERLRDSPMS